MIHPRNQSYKSRAKSSVTTAVGIASDGATRHDETLGVSRVAIVLSELRAGGMERVVVHLAEGLASEGVTPRVLCLQSKGVLAAGLDDIGVHIVRIGSKRSYDLAGVYRLATELKKFCPDVINVHDYSSLPYAVVAGLALPRCPIVFTAHGLLYHGFDGKESRYRFFSRGLRTLTAVSSPVRDRHVSFLNWQGDTSIVPNGVPKIRRSFKVARQLRTELNIGAEDFVFLAVGNPRPEKAFEDLIAASVLVKQQRSGRRFRVLVAGRLKDDEYCHRLQRVAEDAGVSGFRFLGFRDDVHRLYSAADALVVSSRSEGLPMVILEAMTAGLPILSTRVGGIPDAVPGNCGILVEPHQPQELATAMLQLMNLDATLREAMGKAACQHAVEQFGVGRMTKGYLEVFAGVAAKRRGAKYR